MKILSWDVGIKNLAYCLFTKTDVIRIEEWGVLNLNDPPITCNYVCKSKECGKNAIARNNDACYCKAHRKHHIPNNPIITNPTQSQCEYMINGNRLCGKKSTSNLNGVNYCSVHFKSSQKSFAKSCQLIPIANKALSVDQLVLRLQTALEQYPQFLQVDTVLIENQPSLTNPIMKTVSVVLYSYFNLRAFVDDRQSTIQQIKFISPSNKLKISTQPEIKSYQMNKKLSVQYCRALIADDPDKLQLLQNHKKKDDLCDAFLQGFYYVFKEGVPEPYASIIDAINNPNVIDL